MDTNRLKKFASEARAILKRGVAAKMLSLGFDDKGHIDESDMPILIQGGSIFNGQQQTEAFYHRWMSLYHRIQEKGIKEVYEEAAYTWFNRFIAIRILQKNGIIEPLLTFVDVARTPRIVDAARMGHHPQMSAADEELLRTLISDVSAITPQFSLLITAYCHNNPILYKCFGGIADYTELLLPNDILAENGFIDTLNHTEFITDEDFASPELIGWLYQFYISERKDEVFGKSGKWDAEEIPAATQIFTPNWIVKYMVQNTIGRIYLDNNPWATDLKDKWKYLVEPSEPSPEDAKLKYKDLTELRIADLACGSGHILNECFDLLFDLYIEDGYSRGEAIEAIFTKNLTGIDLDTRAKQLATFALLLKACQRDRTFADAHCMPNILNMPEPQKDEEALTAKLHNFFRGNESRQDITALLDAFKLMQDADSLGSIMIFKIPESTRFNIKSTVEYYEFQQYDEEEFAEIIPALKLILALTEKYHALVMNPPYMGAGHMNSTLSDYVKRNYEEGKADLFSTFMILAIDALAEKGKYGMINMQSWMFIASFENLRKSLLDNYYIDSLLHLGPRTFDELSGEVVQNAAFVVSKLKKDQDNHLNTSTGVYFRLVEGKNCGEKENLFSNATDSDCSPLVFHINQNMFLDIPKYAFGYWISDCIKGLFSKDKLKCNVEFKEGLTTANNDLFLRIWHEVDKHRTTMFEGEKIWRPYNKGGGYRKWYGNNFYLVNWSNDGQLIKDYPGSSFRNASFQLREGGTYSALSNDFAARYSPSGFAFDSKGTMFFDNNNLKNDLAYFNSNLFTYLVGIVCPTLDFRFGTIQELPDLTMNCEDITNNCISISRDDWDSHETSWDFKTSPLIAINEDNFLDIINDYADFHDICIDPAAPEPESLEWHLDMFKMKWETSFYRLKQSEEELNHQFIEIYGLQDELEEFVPTSEITILQQGEIMITPEPGDDSGYGDTFIWKDDVLMKQFISYAVGCWMGRYRLDKPGLHIAHPNPTDAEVCTYSYGDSQLKIDDDGIIPILSADSAFDDNLVKRVQEFIRIAFGAEKVNQNISFVEACLGASLEKYLQKDFWKDHKKMYQNRPIYWLFSSKKGAFQCLVYMHRMDANTADKVRSNYLMKHMDWLRQSIAGLEANAVALSTTERNKLKKMKNDLVECEEYNDRLQLIADSRIAFDLDDGVVVNYAKFGDVLAKIK